VRTTQIRASWRDCERLIQLVEHIAIAARATVEVDEHVAGVAGGSGIRTELNYFIEVLLRGLRVIKCRCDGSFIERRSILALDGVAKFKPPVPVVQGFQIGLVGDCCNGD
jgi:hypothetical protein